MLTVCAGVRRLRTCGGWRPAHSIRAPASAFWRSMRSRTPAAPRGWRRTRTATRRRSWSGCTPTTRAVPSRSPIAAPGTAPLLPAHRSRSWQRRPHRPVRRRPPIAGADPPPRWTLRRLVGWVRERFGLRCCRETIRAALHRLDLSWKKAKKLLGRADSAKRQAFVGQVQDLLAGAQRDHYLLVYWDEAHIHQEADLGYGWAGRGPRVFVTSHSPGLSAKLSFYGLYLYNEGAVRLWPYPCANGAHTIEA